MMRPFYRLFVCGVVGHKWKPFRLPRLVVKGEVLPQLELPTDYIECRRCHTIMEAEPDSGGVLVHGKANRFPPTDKLFTITDRVLWSDLQPEPESIPGIQDFTVSEIKELDIAPDALY